MDEAMTTLDTPPTLRGTLTDTEVVPTLLMAVLYHGQP